MKNLYLIINLGSVIVPFLASFHPRLKFYKIWRHLFISLLITNIIFIPWDIWFTNVGVWGFNEQYFLDYSICGLPLEEWMFFICIPYSCVFMHYALQELNPKLITNKILGKKITILLCCIYGLIIIFNYNKYYSVINYSLGFVILLFIYFKNETLLNKYYITFLFMLFPFFIVNGILTGSGIVDQVVWYNNQENLGLRVFTIPIEDITYAFSLIIVNLFIIDYLNKKPAKAL